MIKDNSDKCNWNGDGVIQLQTAAVITMTMNHISSYELIEQLVQKETKDPPQWSIHCYQRQYEQTYFQASLLHISSTLWNWWWLKILPHARLNIYQSRDPWNHLVRLSWKTNNDFLFTVPNLLQSHLSPVCSKSFLNSDSINQFHKPNNTAVPYPTMTNSKHKCAWWNMKQVRCVICELGQFYPFDQEIADKW